MAAAAVIRQSTNIICDGSTLLKLEEKILLVILLLMHVASTSASDDDDAATRRWAPCSPLDDIVDSDAAGTLSTIYSTRAGGGMTHGGDRDSGVVATQRLFFVSCQNDNGLLCKKLESQ